MGGKVRIFTTLIPQKKTQPHHLQKQTQNSWYILNLQASGLRVTEPMNDKSLSEQDGTRE